MTWSSPGAVPTDCGFTASCLERHTLAGRVSHQFHIPQGGVTSTEPGAHDQLNSSRTQPISAQTKRLKPGQDVTHEVQLKTAAFCAIAPRCCSSALSVSILGLLRTQSEFDHHRHRPKPSPVARRDVCPRPADGTGARNLVINPADQKAQSNFGGGRQISRKRSTPQKNGAKHALRPAIHELWRLGHSSRQSKLKSCRLIKTDPAQAATHGAEAKRNARLAGAESSNCWIKSRPPEIKRQPA